MVNSSAMGLFKNVRFYVLLSSAFLASVVYFYVKQTVDTQSAQVIKLTQTYALIAVTYLYLTLLASPLTRFFTFLPFRGVYLYSRRALGMSVFMFGLLHAYYAFFGELGGFAGLQFLNLRYLTAVSLGATSLFILTLLALTAFDRVISAVSFQKWKMLHRLVYLIAMLTTIHALMLGSHFTSFSGAIPQIFSLALAFLLILEALRLDIYLSNRFPSLPKTGVAFFLAAFFITLLTIFTLASSEFSANLSLHETHRQLTDDNLINED